MKRLFLLLSLFVIGWILFFKPYEVTLQNSPPRNIVFENFTFKLITPKEVQAILVGKKGIKEGKRVTIYDFHFQKDKESLSANKGVYQEPLLEVFDNVDYKRPHFELISSYGKYFLDKKILKVPLKFTIFTKEGKIKGDHLVYYLKSDKILARDIYAKIESK